VIVTVEAKPVTVPMYWVHCTHCGWVRRSPGQREAEQWAQHHRKSAHAEAYQP